jgi:hypothetical protein
VKIFADTTAWAALYDRRDKNHETASKFMKELKGEKILFITTDYILDETLTLIRMRVGHEEAVNFGRWLSESGVVRLIDVNPKLRETAWEIFKRYSDKYFSFTDCTSFALMRELNISQAFSFDRHFSQFGFIRLPLERRA